MQTQFERLGSRWILVFVEIVGAAIAISSGPFWAYGIFWSVGRINHDPPDVGGLVALFRLVFAAALFVVSTIGYVIARTSGWTVTRTVVVIEATLANVAAALIALAWLL